MDGCTEVDACIDAVVLGNSLAVATSGTAAATLNRRPRLPLTISPEASLPLEPTLATAPAPAATPPVMGLCPATRGSGGRSAKGRTGASEERTHAPADQEPGLKACISKEDDVGLCCDEGAEPGAGGGRLGGTTGTDPRLPRKWRQGPRAWQSAHHADHRGLAPPQLVLGGEDEHGKSFHHTLSLSVSAGCRLLLPLRLEQSVSDSFGTSGTCVSCLCVPAGPEPGAALAAAGTL